MHGNPTMGPQTELALETRRVLKDSKLKTSFPIYWHGSIAYTEEFLLLYIRGCDEVNYNTRRINDISLTFELRSIDECKHRL